MNREEIQSVKNRFGIIGNSPKIEYAIQKAIQVASTDLTVLIMGESGSGKESFSKIIHQLSHRKHNPFIAINCGAIPEGTIDSELFGHEKGSFTGAVEARKGYFETTDGGTIFLDEIGEMPLGTQARLLRMLENKEFIRVGSSKVQKTDVRVIAATNVQLLDAVAKGKFREDLYYRLSTVPIEVPPLRGGGRDVELLFRKFASDYAEKYHEKPLMLAEEAKFALLQYRFPGNIRQLKNLVEQMSVFESANREISAEVLGRYLPSNQRSQVPALLETPNREESTNFSERELLYKIFFEMKKDVSDLKSETSELKKLVMNLLENEGLSEHHKKQIVKEHSHILENLNPIINPKPITEVQEAMPTSLLLKAPEKTIEAQSVSSVDFKHIQDIEVEEESSLSLHNQEKELIVKALKKYNNRRKYAAQELGISERTLYRKIKQYDLE